MKARKILALVIAFAMILSTMGTVVFAEDTTGSSVAYIGSTGYETLQAAIDAVQNGETIKLATSINETVMVNKNGVAFTIDGAIDGTDENVTYDGVIQINIGQVLTISNIDFVHSVVEDHDFIENVGSPTGKNYNSTLVVDGCSFAGDRGADMVAVRTIHPTDVTVKNCVATGLHSLMQNTGGQKVTINNVTITESKSGVSLGGVRAAEVMNSTINVDESYGIRIDAATAGAVHNIVSCDITAFIPVVTRKASASNVDITVSGDNTMKATNTDNIWFAVGIEEYKNNGDVLTAPTGTVDVSLKDGSLDASGVYGTAAESYEAKIGEEYYATLQDAIDAAEANFAADADPVIYLNKNVVILEGGYYSNVGNNGALNSLTFDLNGHTMKIVTDVKIFTDVIIKNGTVDGTSAGTSPFYVFAKDGKTYDVTFEDVNIISDGNSGYAFISPNGGDPDASFRFIRCTANITNSGAAVSFINAQGGIKVTIEDSEIITDNSGAVFVNVDATITNSTIKATNMKANVFRNFSGTVTNTDINVEGAEENGIKNTNGKTLTINGDSNVVITGAKGYDLILTTASAIVVADTAKLLADTANIDQSSSTTGNVVTKADAVEVDFELYNEEETEITYDIVLKGINAETINRLNSADLTFALSQTTGKNAYEIVDVADDHITFNPVYNVADGSIIDGRYEFHFETKTGVSNDTDSEIVIARVKFTGYGTFGFGVAEAGTNVVHATKIRDNIVDTYVPNDDTTSIAEGELVIDNDFTAEIAIPRRALTVKVSFPNGICENDAAYQDMTLSIVGDGVEVNEKLGYGLQKESNGVVYYEFKCGDTILNTPYTVTLEGAGYRTVKYTVNMTEAKTLNFWNNVKDNDVYVEESASGVKKYAQKVTFLAGDIVKDDDINIYDLSAVVSYFGEIDLSKNNKPTYAKYDLNRDGKIDSKDVAYVLVSWGN